MSCKGYGEVADDIECGYRFLFRNRFGNPSRSKVFSFCGIFCPKAAGGEILQLHRVFDKSVHSKGRLFRIARFKLGYWFV